MTTHPHARTLTGLLLAAIFAATLPAAENEKSLVSAGPALGKLDTPGGDADLTGGTANIQLHLGELLLFDTSLRGSYTYLKSDDSPDIERQDADVDLILSASALGILTPFATAGVSYDKFDALGYSDDSEANTGLALGVGAELVIVPALFSLMPSARYVDSDKLDTLTYALDAQFHFTVVSAGVRVAYEDNRSRDGNLTSADAYVGLRF